MASTKLEVSWELDNGLLLEVIGDARGLRVNIHDPDGTASGHYVTVDASEDALGYGVTIRTKESRPEIVRFEKDYDWEQAQGGKR